MRTLRTAVAAGLVLAAMALVACGGDDPSPASSSSGGGSGKPGIDAKTKKAMLDFARCMREHGINMPDPKFGSNGATVMQQGGKNTTPEQQRAAEQACAKYQKQVKPPQMSEAEQEKFKKAALANARCMRQHGIDMPDPQFGDNGEVQQRIGEGIKPTDPKFQAAMKACGRAGGMMIGGGPAGEAP
jgi:hypothetical protein